MHDTVAVVSALIVERPLCMLCITEKSCLTPEEASVAIGAIERVLKIHREPGRCRGCGLSRFVLYSDRPSRSPAHQRRLR